MGTFQRFRPLSGQPASFAFDAANLLYFSEAKSGTVYTIDRAGRLQVYSRGSGAKPFRSPSGIGFDFRGDLYVADTGNGLIRKVTPDGFVSTIAGGGSSDQDGFGLTLQLKSPSRACGCRRRYRLVHRNKLACESSPPTGRLRLSPIFPFWMLVVCVLTAVAGCLLPTPAAIASSGSRRMANGSRWREAANAATQVMTALLSRPPSTIPLMFYPNPMARSWSLTRAIPGSDALFPSKNRVVPPPPPEDKLGSFRILRIENSDGTLNGADSAAARGSEIALITAGEMKGGYLRRDCRDSRQKSPPSVKAK